MKRNRLTDNDTNWGPITIGENSASWRPIGIVIDSGDDDENPGCSLKLYTGGRTIRLALPPILLPYRRKVEALSWDAATVARLGRNWYWDTHAREYGFRLSDGFLQVFLGPQTHDSKTTKSWCAHLPWTQWRHVRHSMYGLNGEHYWTEAPKARRNWDDWHKAREQCPKRHFLIEDFDGSRIVASTYIEEREWHFGEKWCSWLSLFRKPMVKRSLDIAFEHEVGLDKGSWKGGLMGHSIEMLPGELHEEAFRRYCEQEVRSKHGRSRITFIGPIEEPAPSARVPG